jgi:LmbE family N-acetylglucosaminyl deacetylase
MNHSAKSIYALGIVAHPDDETFLFAGTSLGFAKQGRKVAVVCATKGEKGADRLGRNLTKKQMAQERVAELKRATKLIKVSKLDFFNYPDGGLDQIDFMELTRKLIKKIDQYKPQIILTFGNEGISGHRDHIVIGRAAIIAANAAIHKPKEIWLASMPRSKIKEFNEHLNKRKVHLTHFHPTILKGVPDSQLKVINISKYSKTKMKAIQTHKSQYLPGLIMDNFLKNEYFETVRLKKP